MSSINPKEIYEGLNSFFRNLLPGLLILFPFFPLLNYIANLYTMESVEKLTFYFVVYVVISGISHMVWEIFGYFGVYFFETKRYIKQDVSSLQKNPKLLGCFYFNIISSYFLYRHKIHYYYSNEKESLDCEAGMMRSEEKRLSKKLEMDIDWINRVNSYLIAMDIYIIGTVLIVSFLKGFRQLVVVRYEITFLFSQSLENLQYWYIFVPVFVLFFTSRIFAVVHAENEIAFFRRLKKLG